MTGSLSNLVNNLSDGIHRIKYKYGHDDKKCETFRINYKYSDCFLESRKFYIRRNNNKVDSTETGRIVITHLLP